MKYKYIFLSLEEPELATHVRNIPEWITLAAKQGITSVVYTNEYGKKYEYKISQRPLTKEEKLEAIIDEICSMELNPSLLAYIEALAFTKERTGNYYE